MTAGPHARTRRLSSSVNRKRARLRERYPPYASRVDAEEVWIPLVDEPIGSIVAQVQREHPELDRIVNSPRRLLAFRTFAYIRVGLVLGQLLVEHDVAPYDGSETWVERLLRDPAHRARIVGEVTLVADEVAADPRYGHERLGPDPAARDRFRTFARARLAEPRRRSPSARRAD